MSRVVPAVLGTVRTYGAGMSQVVPPVLGTVRTGILEGLASGTSWDVSSSPSCSWDCQDRDSRGANL